MSAFNLLWKLAHARWRGGLTPSVPGYSLLLPVPADLPVFLELALAVCGRQSARYRAETLVIPDQPLATVAPVVERAAKAWDGPLRLVQMPRRDALLLRLSRNPHANYFLQFVNGVEAARGSHAVLHDADAFLFDPDCLDDQYRLAVDRQLDVLGVNQVWDSWFAERGMKIAATWEQLFRVEWAKSFPPHLHRGHANVWNGDRHVFDVTILPQCQTLPERIDLHPWPGKFAHFNYVICTYRYFQKSNGPFEDEYFRLLLVRLLIDAFDRSGWQYEVPTTVELARGLTDANSRVTYRAPATADHYPEFRQKLAGLLASELVPPAVGDRLVEGVAAFDRAFDWQPQSLQPVLSAK